MRYFVLFGILVFSCSLFAENKSSWHGFCIVKRDELRICSASYPRSSDYTQICNAFAQEEKAGYWSAQFFSSIEFLRSSIPEYCDVVRDNSTNNFYACQTESLCLSDSARVIKHLASKVYASDENKALSACFQKEESRYEAELKKQSLNGCFMRIVAERLEY